MLLLCIRLWFTILPATSSAWVWVFMCVFVCLCVWLCPSFSPSFIWCHFRAFACVSLFLGPHPSTSVLCVCMCMALPFLLHHYQLNVIAVHSLMYLYSLGHITVQVFVCVHGCVSFFCTTFLVILFGCIRLCVIHTWVTSQCECVYA